MKNQIFQISFILLSSILLMSATVLTFDGWSDDMDVSNTMKEECLSLDNKIETHVLDTTQFVLSTSCYEYCQFEECIDDNNHSDELSKTIVKVENSFGEYEDIETSSIKNLPPNSSLNLMIEKYTVKRRFLNEKPSFFVTVESFNTTIQRNNLFDFKINVASDNDASLSDKQMKLIKQLYQDDEIAKICDKSVRPL